MKFSKLILFLAIPMIISSCSSEDTAEETQNPSAFNLLQVANNATEVSFTPTLTWQKSTVPNDGSVTYDLYIQKANEVENGSLPSQLYKGNLTTNTHTLTEPLLASTHYKWYVKATSNGNTTNSSSVFSFITAAVENQPPNSFDLISPFDTETDVPSDPILSWQAASDPENDPVVYEVYLGVNIPDTQIGVDVPATNLPVGSLLPNTTYSWYVQARDDAGNGKNSSVFTFTTGDGSVSGSGGYNIISSNAIPNQIGRFGHQMVEYNGKIWVIGGTVLNSNNTGGEYNDVWNSGDEGVTWNLVKGNTPEMGFVRSDEHQAVVFRNEMWVIDGNRNTAHKSSDGITWENVPFSGNVSEGTHYDPRNQFQALVMFDRLFVIGGSSGGILKNDVWSTDGVPDTNGEIEWILDTDNAGFEPRYGHQAVVFKNKMYVVAGAKQGGQRLNDVWSSSNGVNWGLVTANASFTERTEHVVVVQNDGEVMYVFGGDGIDPNTGTTVASLNDVWVSDDGGTWVNYIPHISDDSDPDDYKGRKEFDALPINGDIIIFGGKHGTQLLNDIWYLDNFL